jgi:hypothetical protein
MDNFGRGSGPPRVVMPQEEEEEYYIEFLSEFI